MHVNKVHHVTTINRVAKDLGENEDWLSDVASEMDVEDGIIWVYGAGDDGAMAFTDFGIENLIDLIKSIRTIPRCSSAVAATNSYPRPRPDGDCSVVERSRSVRPVSSSGTPEF
jgi:hypothetical protein